MRISLSVCLAAAIALFGSAAAATPAQRPNILFFLVDDMGVADTSVPFLYDLEDKPVAAPLNARYRTPNMENLARQGRKFVNAHAYPVCTPTRVSLMTGIAAPRMHITTWTHPQVTQDTDAEIKNGVGPPNWRKSGIDLSLPTLPGILRDAGYRTIHCGKAHFGPEDTRAGDPRSLGFDINIAGFGGGGPGSYWGEKNFSAAWRGGGHEWDVPDLEKYHGKDVFLTEALTRELAGQLELAVAAEKPFFAYMSHYAVHAPFETDSRFAANYPDLQGKDLAFATLVEGMDRSLGDLIDKLDELGVAENTLIVFYSDNGSEGPPNAPLRGRKGTRWEGGIRVPMMVAWAKPDPSNRFQKLLPIPAASIDRTLVQPADFLPTLAAIANAKLPKNAAHDGHDVSAAFRGIPGTHRPPTFLAHFPHSRGSDAYFTSYIDGDRKISYSYSDKKWHFTNLAYEIGEHRDLSDSVPKVALAMAKRMVATLGATGAQLPVDSTTGAAMAPDLAPLKKLAEAHTRQPQQPFAADDLDLSPMVRPVSKQQIYRDEGFYTWCNSIIRDKDGTYHLFYVRWPREHGFYGWLTHSEIARAVSENPAGPYTFRNVVLPSRGEHPWNRITAHNVKITELAGKYYLYFISTNDGGRNATEADLAATARTGYSAPLWQPLRNNQRTGVATADSLDGPWKVHEKPVVEPRGPISNVTVNPAVWQTAENRFHMIVKGDSPASRVAQALAIADNPLGPFIMQPDLVFDRYSEDVSVWQDPARNLTYGILHDGNGFGMIASDDGRHWRNARHFRILGKTIPRSDDSPLRPTRLERPNIHVENGIPRVLSCAAQFDGGKDAFIVLIPLEPEISTEKSQ